MGRHAVTIPIDSDMLRKVISDNNFTPSKLSRAYGVTRQAVNGWFKAGRIPPRVLADLARELNLPPEIVKEIVRKENRYAIKIQIELVPI